MTVEHVFEVIEVTAVFPKAGDIGNLDELATFWWGPDQCIENLTEEVKPEKKLSITDPFSILDTADSRFKTDCTGFRLKGIEIGSYDRIFDPNAWGIEEGEQGTPDLLSADDYKMLCDQAAKFQKVQKAEDKKVVRFLGLIQLTYTSWTCINEPTEVDMKCKFVGPVDSLVVGARRLPVSDIGAPPTKEEPLLDLDLNA